MRLYCTPAGQWAGTQADARQLGSFEQIEVPTDKAGLLEFLNRHQVGAQLDDTCGGGTDEQPAPVLGQPDPMSIEIDENVLIDFLLDKADGRAVERIFEVLGTRFHEMRKAAA